VLYEVVERHHGAFFAHPREQGKVLPEFVRGEFDAYLRWLSGLSMILCE
jgi:hypothetical protein